MTETILPSDSEYRGLAALLPASIRPFAVLARLDRPIGWWLLFWPCAWGVALAGGAVERWDLLLWLLLGAIAMRGAGCVYNDIVDRDLDRMVARTASRPLASGAVSVRAACVWLLLLCAVGLIVLCQLGRPAIVIALSSIALVAAYPFMKRITWWPQIWLGLVFSWGALVAWVEVAGRYSPALVLLYLGTVVWVIGYDTIYAVQDIEDDAIVGIRSSARAMGRNVRAGVALCYGIAILLWGGAIWLVRPDGIALIALAPAALHLGWQVISFDGQDGANALACFRSNRWAGMVIFAAMFVVGTTT